jgi:hypothetical protein
MKIITCLSLSVVSMLSFGQITQSGDKYTVQAKYKAGQVTKLIMSVKSESVKGQVPVNTIINGRTKVLKVAKDGSATLEIYTPPFAGQPARTQKQVVDKYGRPVGGNMGTFSGNFSWPLYPIKIGDNWSGNVNLSAGEGAPSIPVKATYKFIGIRNTAGVKVAVVKANMDLSSLFEMRGTGEMLIRFDDGQLYESTLKMTMSVPDPKTQKLTKTSLLVSVKNRR